MGGVAPPQFPSPVVTVSSPDDEFPIDWKLRTQDPRPQSSGKVGVYRASLQAGTKRVSDTHQFLNARRAADRILI